MVHAALSSLGYIAGGAQAVVLALLDAVGADGTLIMPTHSGDLSDPAEWRNPPVPEEWWATIRASTPAFDPELTPTRKMGAIAECLRHVRRVLRSNHPTVSAAAVGPNAEVVVSGHELAFGLGESSPQARLYDLDGWVLLLGVTHANNTSLHLAEYRSTFPNKPWTTHSSPFLIKGGGDGSLTTTWRRTATTSSRSGKTSPRLASNRAGASVPESDGYARCATSSISGCAGWTRIVSAKAESFVRENRVPTAPSPNRGVR